MELKELLDKYDKGHFEVEFKTDYMEKSGFFVLMKPMDRDLEMEFTKKCKVTTFDPRSHQRIEEFDNEKFAALADEKLICGWRGLSPRLASILIPSLTVADDVPSDTEIPCSPESKRLLMAKSKDFAKFVMAIVMDACKVKADIMEEEEKN